MIKTLLGVRLRSLAASLSGKRGEKKSSIGKTALFVFLYAYLAVVFVGLSVLMAMAMGNALISLDGGRLYLALFASATFAALFVISVFETKSELFECKDNELILSMPIKPSDIVLSRIFAVLIYNYAIALVMMLPAAIVYIAISGDPVGFIGALLLMLIIPLPATALSGFFGYLVALLSRRAKHKTLVSVLFSLAFIFVYMWFYIRMMSIDEGFFENIAGSPLFTGTPAAVLGVIGNAVLLRPLELSVFLAVSIAVTLAAYALLSKNYIRIVTSSAGSSRAQYKAKRMKKGSAFTALFKKELSKILSSSIYLLNAGIGAVLRVALGVIAVVKSGELLAILDALSLEASLGSTEGVKCLGVILAVTLLSSTDGFSASSISLEGKNLWIIRSMPIRPYDVLMAKTLAHTAICGAASLISALLMLIALSASTLSYVVALPTVIALTVCFAIFGTVINVALPKLDFESEAQPVKQSLSAAVVLFGQMFFGVALLILSFFGLLEIGGFFVSLIILAIYLLLSLILYLVAARVSVRKFANL